MNRSLILSVAVLFGVSFVSASADHPPGFSPQPMRAAPSPGPAIAPAPPTNPRPAPQQPAPQPPTAKSPTKPTSPNCNTPCPRTGATIVIYPAYSYPVYSYPVYSYPVYYSEPSYGSSRSTYRSDERVTSAEKDQGYDISYEDDYWKRGRNWGQDLRREIVDFDDFVAFLQQEIVSTPESLRSQFEKGFAEGYGLHADKAFKKAFELATKQGAKTEQPPRRVE